MNILLGVFVGGENRGNRLEIERTVWKVASSPGGMNSIPLEVVGNLKSAGCHPPRVSIYGSLSETRNAETVKYLGSYAVPMQTHPNYTKSPLNSHYRPPVAFYPSNTASI